MALSNLAGWTDDKAASAYGAADKPAESAPKTVLRVHRAGDALPYPAEPLLTLWKLLCGLPGKGDRKARIT